MKTVIVGSGAGGSSVFSAIAGERDVTLVERGPPLKPCSSTDLAAKYYEIFDAGGMEVWQTICDGGSTVVSLGNGVRSLEKELKGLGVDISEELGYIEKELGIRELPWELLGGTSRRLFEVMEDCGYRPVLMPKFIEFSRCRRCGRCAFGCLFSARWDARNLLRGARVVNGFQVEKVLTKDGEVRGVEGRLNGSRKSIKADEVVLSAGAIHTPAILQASGLEAGGSLFVDPFVTVGGVIKGARQDREIPMGFFAGFGDFILSPHYSVFLQRKLEKASRDIAGLMVKIKDDNVGAVEGNRVTKTLTEGDWERLEKGIHKAKAVLEAVGVKDIAVTHIRGVHQGGTYPLDSKDLDTEVEGLYVADASLLPEAPGRPPMLAVMGLARKVGQRVLEG